jgi:hypothetical protein
MSVYPLFSCSLSSVREGCKPNRPGYFWDDVAADD